MECWILTKFSWVHNWNLAKNQLDFGDLGPIFKVTAVEKLKFRCVGQFFFSENTVTSLFYFTIVGVKCRAAAVKSISVLHHISELAHWSQRKGKHNMFAFPLGSMGQFCLLWVSNTARVGILHAVKRSCIWLNQHTYTTETLLQKWLKYVIYKNIT